MASQYVWIAIAVGVFFAGLAVGYGIFLSTQPQTTMWNPQMFGGMMQQNPQMANQWTQQMMQDQTGRQQMMTSMMQDQQFMNDMMNQPQFREQMIQNMQENHDFTEATIMGMIDDPQIRGQIIGHMLENQEFMEQLRQSTGNQTGSGGMGMMQ